MQPPNFEDFYGYAFQYCLTGELDVDRHPTFNQMEMTLFHDNVLLYSCYLSLSLSASLPLMCVHAHILLAGLMLMTFSEEKQRFVDIETICELLNLVLGSQFRAQVDLITKYLKVGFYFSWT